MRRKLLTLKSAVLGTAALALILALAGEACHAAGNDWKKMFGKQRSRRSGQRHTTVAAVRGVDEPSEVDPEARNYEAVEKMEARSYPADKVSRFASEGKLVRVKIQPSQPGAAKEAGR